MIWRWIAGGLAMALAGMAVLFWRGSSAQAEDALLPLRPATEASGGVMEPMPDAPRASEKTREERRFNRYDKDQNDQVSREEYLASRRKAFARLDTNGDGRLSFDEWAVKATGKFAKADADKSATLSRTEFATTAVKRKTPAKVNCPPEKSSNDDES